MIPPYVFIALGLALIFVVAVLYAACMMAGMADDALEAERLPSAPEDVEAMLLTWDEICRLPEVRP